jgi:hypothetical protein
MKVPCIWRNHIRVYIVTIFAMTFAININYHIYHERVAKEWWIRANCCVCVFFLPKPTQKTLKMFTTSEYGNGIDSDTDTNHYQYNVTTPIRTRAWWYKFVQNTHFLFFAHFLYTHPDCNCNHRTSTVRACDQHIADTSTLGACTAWASGELGCRRCVINHRTVITCRPDMRDILWQ